MEGGRITCKWDEIYTQEGVGFVRTLFSTECCDTISLSNWPTNIGYKYCPYCAKEIEEVDKPGG